jgi:hypothetical protein
VKNDRIALCLLVALATTACGNPAQYAIDRAVREYNCPRDQMHARWLSYSKDGEVYKVTGCGVAVAYDCSSSGNCSKEPDSGR